MKKLIISIVVITSIISAGVLLNTKTAKVTNPKATTFLEETSAHLKALFGSEANNITLEATESVGGKTIYHLKSNGALFDVDQENNLLRYYKIKPSKNDRVSKGAALNLAKKRIKELLPEKKLNNYKLVSSIQRNDNHLQTYDFYWELKNNNDVITNSISATTSLGGELIRLSIMDKDVPAANIQAKITKDEAVTIAKNLLKKTMNPSDFNTLQFTLARKWINGNNLYWIVSFDYKAGSNGNESYQANTSIIIDTQTGEVIKPEKLSNY